ncbi:MAG: cytochrome c oxidase subunit 3 family protein [Planctomycetes bacterium]|nr:cytochrome c oxidase subunit 3 family protein [Planctomycetota bacterium]MCP4770005.1 cytochrome c oxidase subunit 3 family protein [Planctomycetota bacterium]MCP4859845.1 cytochrome c oxidase subunit 3 family protein [Planctomycetota bacterium]
MSQTTSKRRSLPGDAAWWMFLTAEFLTLGIFFVAYAFSRAGNVEAFQASQAELHPQLAFANTLILITSGFFAARGVLAMQAGKAAACSKWYALSVILGVAFLVIKTVEYADRLGAGVTLSTSTFYFFYFFLTGFHYLHVILGVGFLSWMAAKTYRQSLMKEDPEVATKNLANVESCAAFWHMLDLVWIVLFPLLYLA